MKKSVKSFICRRCEREVFSVEEVEAMVDVVEAMRSAVGAYDSPAPGWREDVLHKVNVSCRRTLARLDAIKKEKV
jgi:hypothetical protein